MGFNSDTIGFDQNERHLGNSKYTLKKMLLLAISGITSFSTVPLRMIFLTGFIVLIISIFMSLKVLFNWYQEDVVAGWTELMLSIYFLGAIQLIAIGFIGEYIAKIHDETIDRPRYIIDKLTKSKSL
jgi:glycosyltransferase involved in cell wall biosynthesis